MSRSSVWALRRYSSSCTRERRPANRAPVLHAYTAAALAAGRRIAAVRCGAPGDAACLPVSPLLQSLAIPARRSVRRCRGDDHALECLGLPADLGAAYGVPDPVLEA